MSNILTALAAADEEYLVVMASKGLYKRAQKELPEAGIVVTISGEAVTANFADGTLLTMEGNIQNYKCSCPSRSICKHLLMAVLAARAEVSLASEDGQNQSETVDPAPPPEYGLISEITGKQLEKLAGKRAFQSAVLAVRLGETCEIEEASTLRVTLKDGGHTVIFLPGSPPDVSRCTCKKEAFCVHKAQAVVQYIHFKKGTFPDDFQMAEEEDPLEFSSYALPYIQRFVVEIMDTGLARLPNDTRGRFLQLATICHGQRLANMERFCNRIAGHLEHFAARSATFDRNQMITDLCSLLYAAQALEAGNREKELVGVFRESYGAVPKMELWGLGAWGWQSTGGYRGITISFFCPGEAKPYTFTSVLPLERAPDMEKLYMTAAPWGLNEKLADLAQGRLILKGGKVSGRRQLSASEESVAGLIGTTDIMSPELAPLRFDDFELLLEALWQQAEEGEDGFMTAILLPERAEISHYDPIGQRWSLVLRDKGQRRLSLSVGYEQSTDLLISNLRHFESLGQLCEPMLARVSLEGGGLTAYPVALYGEEVFNLSLDKVKTPKKQTEAIFDWGNG